MKTKSMMLCIAFLCLLFARCEQEYSDRYLYIAVAGDYGVPFTGSYGDQFIQHEVQSKTPDYYYFHLSTSDNYFLGEFSKPLTVKKDVRKLTVRLYLKEFPAPASLLVEISEVHPDSVIVVTYID
jgi:hypothetical protein